MENYDYQKIEKKWAKKWVKDKAFTPDLDNAKNPYYALFMFPYPSAEGLHIGNFYCFTSVDVMAKYKKLQGYDVFEPFGFDAFGMHLENYALKLKELPKKVEKRTTTNFRKQIQSAGLSCDYTREVDTTKPEYYKWTQWLFTKLFEKGLAYQKEALLNWCPSCKTVLADEQIEDGVCERCKTVPEKKNMKQWFFKITAYAQRMLDGLDKMDWSDITKSAQKNWINRSEGAEIKFEIKNLKIKNKIKVFTTRPDTLFGATYFVMSPEHPLLKKIVIKKNKKNIEEYIKISGAKSELERTENKEKTGVFTGAYAINPVNNKEIPIWIADYVMMGYGTGAIMAVPAHDERDFEFAKKYNLPIKQVVKEINSNKNKIDKVVILHGRQRYNKIDVLPQNIRHWLGWLKNEIEKNSIIAINPLIPKDWKATYSDWKKEFEKNEITKNTILVGTSAGGSFLVRWLGETKKQIKRLILVAPAKYTNDIHDKNKQDFYNFKIDSKIKKRIKDIVIFISNDSEKMLKSADLYTEELNAKLIKLENRGHFTVTANPINKEFSELLDEILNFKCFVNEGININSEFLDGLKTKQAKEKMIDWLEKNNFGKKTINYRLRDWCISRQRYWGPPVPVIYCEKCGIVSVPEKDLPVKLPELKKDWEPAGDGRGPLAKVDEFINTTCPKCGKSAKREADVMDNFLDSAWYFFRYISPKNSKQIFDKKLSKKWLPVDLYIGGNEHAVLHLMYTRFITMFLHDLGLIDFDNPFKKFRANGMILKDGKKMSKSKGNVINPEEYGKKIGYDALKTYLLFLGPLSDNRSFTESGAQGTKRWIEKIVRLEKKVLKNYKDNKDIIRKTHQTIKKLTEDFEEQKYNTSIAKLMELTNAFVNEKNISYNLWQKFLAIIAPFTPALSEELWKNFGNKKSIFENKNWPEYDEELIKEDLIKFIVQVNGKTREIIEVKVNILEEKAIETAMNSKKIKKWTQNKKIIKTIFVKNKLVNIVVN